MAVLPAVSWSRALRLDPTCLVIGSMAPDFEYFARGELAGSGFSHTFAAIALWGVPVTLLVATLFHRVVLWPALLAAPATLRVAPRGWPGPLSIATLGSLIVSAALGDLTHVLWDGVTHAEGVVTRNAAALQTMFALPVVGDMALYRILQHTSTAIGVCAVAWYAVGRLRAAARLASPGTVAVARARWAFAIGVAIAAALAVIRLHIKHVHDPGSLIAGSISGLLAGSLIASLILRAPARRYRASGPWVSAS